jgi:copper resistance protein C
VTFTSRFVRTRTPSVSTSRAGRTGPVGTLAAHRALSIALAVGALLMGGAGAAGAHDELVGTSPAAGSTAAVAPQRVTLTLSQPALAVGTIVIVTGPDGPVQTGKPTLVDNVITQRLQPGSPAGRYTVAWRATSSDGHPVSGTFSFSAAKASSDGTTPTTTAAPPTAPSTSATSAASTTPTAPAASTPASSTPADATESSSALWWAVAAVVAALLLLAGFVLGRKPRSTPQGERDPSPEHPSQPGDEQ